jgi:glucose/arabinose dehydrogenase
MSAHRSTALLGVLLPVAAAASLAGCGASSHGNTTGAGTTATSPARTPPAHGAPVVVARIPFAGNLTFDARGRLWVGSGAGKPSTDGVWLVPKGGRPREVIQGVLLPFGLAWKDDRLYVGHAVTLTEGAVTVFEGFDGRRFKSHHDVLRGLPIGHHSVGTIRSGPGGRLFVGVGARHDNSGPAGRIVSFTPDGGTPVTEATGLRSAFGLAFDGNRLLVTDNGRDDLGRLRPRDELNVFDPAGPVVDFGFPGCYNQGGGACAGTRRPFVTFAPHASPTGVGVKDGVAFVAENGSSFSKDPTGNDVVRIELRTGEKGVFWRSPIQHDPSGLAVGPDGNLYVTMYASGEVVRFSL